MTLIDTPNRPATTSRYVRRHHGSVAASMTILCWAGVSAMPRCFFTLGGSLLVTGLVVANPHLMARLNALETTPAIFLTVFPLSGRGALVLRVWPPDFSNLAHSRVRCSGVISPSGFANSYGEMYAACSR